MYVCLVYDINTLYEQFLLSVAFTFFVLKIKDTSNSRLSLKAKHPNWTNVKTPSTKN